MMIRTPFNDCTDHRQSHIVASLQITLKDYYEINKSSPQISEALRKMNPLVDGNDRLLVKMADVKKALEV